MKHVNKCPAAGWLGLPSAVANVAFLLHRTDDLLCVVGGPGASLCGTLPHRAGLMAWLLRLAVQLLQDRVEPSHEQLSRCIAVAENLTQVTSVNTRVVGWYHSHPHITVHPSHVDLRTQVRNFIHDRAHWHRAPGRRKGSRKE